MAMAMMIVAPKIAPTVAPTTVGVASVAVPEETLDDEASPPALLFVALLAVGVAGGGGAGGADGSAGL